MHSFASRYMTMHSIASRYVTMHSIASRYVTMHAFANMNVTIHFSCNYSKIFNKTVTEHLKSCVSKQRSVAFSCCVSWRGTQMTGFLPMFCLNVFNNVNIN